MDSEKLENKASGFRILETMCVVLVKITIMPFTLPKKLQLCFSLF